MRPIDYPFRASGNLPRQPVAAVLLAVLICAAGARASRRPLMGGTLRVQMHERVATIDPRQWPSESAQAAAAERLDSLVFDRLMRLDDHGVPQPALAISWQHDAEAKRWQFRLREGVKFSDGVPLTSEAVALALQQILGNEFDVSANSDSVIIQGNRSFPGLLEQLGAGRYFIFHTAEDNSLIGTGPFRVAEWLTAETSVKAVFVANDSCWAGRPFADKIEFTMGVDPQQQSNAIAFGIADVVELPASQVRRTLQRGVRVASSDPVELFALVTDSTRLAVRDARLRQAVSFAIDRNSIADVVLQRQAMTAGGLLPNWVSGYAHLFPASLDVSRARELLASSGHELSRPVPLVLVYDSADAEARAVAERVAVNLKEAGIAVQPMGQPVDGRTRSPAADLRLVRERITSPDVAVALPALLASFGEPSAALETPEQEYAAERAPIDAFRIIPLVHVSESYGLSPQVRDWMPPRWGGWRLEDVWLEPAPGAGGSTP
jgi:peptide/nickel transport system substrate-binding protein